MLRGLDDGVAPERRLAVVASKETRGGVFSLETLHGKVVAGIGGTVQVFRWDAVAGGGAMASAAEMDAAGGPHELNGEGIPGRCVAWIP
jgi:hypothetical protein